MTPIIILLVLIQLKHYLCDFPLQTQNHLSTKGIYGNLGGISHSVNHGLGTYVVFAIMGLGMVENNLQLAIIMGLIDAVIHYHIDWIKTRFGQKDITKKSFWNQLGLDQLAHQLTYVLIIGLYFNEILKS